MQELPKNCSDVRASLPLFVGRDLEAVEIEAVQAHLKDCEPCRAELASAEAARGALLSLHGSQETAASLDPFPAAPLGSLPEFDLPEAEGQFDQAEGQLDQAEAQFDLWPGIQAQLLAEGRIRTESAPAPAFRFLAGGKQRWIAAAAAALLLAWLGIALNNPQQEAPRLAGEPSPAQPALEVTPLEVTPIGASTELAVQPLEDSAEVEFTGGLRAIDPSEGLRRKARIFPLDAPAHRPFDVRLRENPNAAVGYN